MFAGAMAGMAYVRNTYEPRVSYSAMNQAELDASGVDTSSPSPEPAKKRRAKPPTTPRPPATPTAEPRDVRPKAATSESASAEPSEPSRSASPSKSPEGPLSGLETLFNGGERR